MATEPFLTLSITCLVPVSWPKNGWPVVNGNGVVFEKMTCPTLPLKPLPKKPARIDFDQPLGLEWNYIQYPDYNYYSLEARKGFLRLQDSSETISTGKTSSFVGRRLDDFIFAAITQLDFNPINENEEAGIILLNNGTHFDLIVKKEKNKRILLVKLQFGSITHQSDPVVLKSGPVKLQIKGDKNIYSFLYSQGSDEYKNVEQVNTRFLSTETAGGFTGVYVGLYATGNGRPSKTFADYDWFEYIKK